jgi:hypothetical protein
MHVYFTESELEKRHGDSLRKLHAECESLRERCTRSKRDLREARMQINNSSSHLDLLENSRYESRIEDYVSFFPFLKSPQLY